ncbi:MAG: hypothetical protein ACXWZG_00560 [Microbacterium sp.]
MIGYSQDELDTRVEEAITRTSPVSSADAETRRARSSAEREDLALARAALAHDFDAERLDALARGRQSARRARIDDGRRRASEDSLRLWKELGALTPALPDPSAPMNVIIDRVTFIRSFAGAGAVTDSNIGSLDSWAKYRLNVSSQSLSENGTGRLSFFTLWRNPRTVPITARIGARLVTNAHLSADADWNGVAAWFIGGSKAQATVRARTTVMAMWDSSLQAIVNDVILDGVGATGGFFGGDDSTTVSMNDFLIGSAFSIPASASVLIDVALLTEWEITSGSVAVDADSGDFQVAVPHLIIEVV